MSKKSKKSKARPRSKSKKSITTEETNNNEDVEHDEDGNTHIRRKTATGNKSTIRFTSSGGIDGENREEGRARSKSRMSRSASLARRASRKSSIGNKLAKINFSVFSFDTWDSDEEDDEDEDGERRKSTRPSLFDTAKIPTVEKSTKKEKKQSKAEAAAGEKKGKGKKTKKKKKKTKESTSEIEAGTTTDDGEQPPTSKTISSAVTTTTVPTATTLSAPEESLAAPEEHKKAKKKKGKKKSGGGGAGGGPKKKLSKKEKLRLAAEMAEKARIEAEEAAARAAEEERIRLEQEKRAAIEKEKRETFEQQIRCEQLENSLKFYNLLVQKIRELNRNENDQEEWELYVNCGRLPNPSKYDQMNTFLHLWEKTIDETTMAEAAERSRDVLKLLNDLDDLIDINASNENYPPEIIANWKWIRLLFRENQAKSLDVATYRLLRNIELNMNRIDIPTADYHYKDENFALCLWLKIQLPTALPNPRKPARTKIELTFSEIKMDVQFPLGVDGEKIVVRALYRKYDHLSDLSDSFNRPDVPKEYRCDLLDAVKKEWRDKLFYKYDNRVRPPPPPPPGPGEEIDDEAALLPPPEPIIGPNDPIPIVPYRKLEPTASEFVIMKEDALYSEIRDGLERMATVSDSVINLRRFTVIGGVYSLHLIHQPPQPQKFVTLDLNLTPLSLPKQLELVDFYVRYDPPEPPEAGVRRLPEEIEEEMKKQEEEFDKLILITLTWPEHVIFLELPIVCFWDEEDLVWTRDDVYDLKHNEEKGQLSFRTGKCGLFALATNKYANLPYQAWEIRPEQDGSITLQITAAVLLVEFLIRNDGLVALTQLQNSPNNAMQDILNVPYKISKLMRIMQNCGVDLFPAFDAFCYIESGTCEKHWPMEKHLYYNMAQLAVAFNFAWSRWNLAAGRRSVVMQMREYNAEKTKQKNHSMALVTPQKALLIDCTEVSQLFNEEGVEGMKFYSDLYTLMKGTTAMAVQNKVKQANGQVVHTLYELLTSTRILSFS